MPIASKTYGITQYWQPKTEENEVCLRILADTWCNFLCAVSTSQNLLKEDFHIFQTAKPETSIGILTVITAKRTGPLVSAEHQLGHIKDLTAQQ